MKKLRRECTNDDKEDDIKGEELRELLESFKPIKLPTIGEVGDISTQLDLGASGGMLETPIEVLLRTNAKLSSETLHIMRVHEERKRRYEEGKKPKKGKPGRRKLKYWQRKKRIRDRGKKYYEEKAKWEVMERDCYDQLFFRLIQHGGLKITREEMGEIIPGYRDIPSLKVKRYDTSLGFDRDNLVIYNRNTEAILWDGIEEKMRSLGYIL